MFLITIIVFLPIFNHFITYAFLKLTVLRGRIPLYVCHVIKNKKHEKFI